MTNSSHINYNKLSNTSRLLIALASLSLIGVFFLPVWRIDLFAPQYPEGLTMKIWINGLSGDVDVINGLNHYIGMEKISENMFPEFSYLPYIVGFFIVLGLTVAFTRKRKLLLLYLGLTIAGGALAMYDFYQWGYKYGHKLDPTAPIQVPGLSYQPPLLGHKRLLNFDAYSLPDAGGWIVIVAGVIAFIVLLVEWFRHRKKLVHSHTKSNKQVIPVVLLLLLFSCSTKPQPFVVGKDNCHFCKMGITDTRFGGELITKKGKVYKFDDVICLANFLKDGGEEKANIAKTLVMLFEKSNEFIATDKAFFAISPDIKSPMASNTAAFSSLSNAKEFVTNKQQSTIIDWMQFLEKVK